MKPIIGIRDSVRPNSAILFTSIHLPPRLLKPRSINDAIDNRVCYMHTLRPKLSSKRLCGGTQRELARGEGGALRRALERCRGAGDQQAWRVRGSLRERRGLEEKWQGAVGEVEKAPTTGLEARRVLLLCQLQEWLADELAAHIVDCGSEVLVGGLRGNGLQCRGYGGCG